MIDNSIEKTTLDILFNLERIVLKRLSSVDLKIGAVLMLTAKLRGDLKKIFGKTSPILSKLKKKEEINDQNKIEILKNYLSLIRGIIQSLKHFETEKPISGNPTIFLGHGRNLVWSRIQTFIQNELGYDVVLFEGESRASSHVVDVLKEMMNRCNSAVIVMTAEDETVDGDLRARQNVIHEIGLFQGKCGFENVIVFQQSGIEEFSNNAGLQTVRFASNPEDGFYQLERAIKKIYK